VGDVPVNIARLFQLNRARFSGPVVTVGPPSAATAFEPSYRVVLLHADAQLGAGHSHHVEARQGDGDNLAKRARHGVQHSAVPSTRLGHSWHSDFANNAQVRAAPKRQILAMSNRKVALVTGANKGIGLQIAKDLVALDFIVVVGSRDLERGLTAARVVGPGGHAVQLDVTDVASIARAEQRIRADFGRLDVLVNNAGISYSGDPAASFEDKVNTGRPSTASLSETRAVFETNVFGVIAVTQAMLPLLREAPAGRIVNVSSTVGSLALQTDPANPFPFTSVTYVPSKTALNAVTVAFANELRDTRIKVNAACPGFTATDLNTFRGTRSVAEGARQAVRLALLGADGPTGTFSNDDGIIPW